METNTLIIPETSPTRYLSGIVALNIISVCGTGDWHQDIFSAAPATLSRSFVIERGQDFDPSAMLGSEGLYDAVDMLDQMPAPARTGVGLRITRGQLQNSSSSAFFAANLPTM